MPAVICTCSYCSKCKVTINGIDHPGKEVSSVTRRDHEKRDKQKPNIHQRHPPSSSSVFKSPDPPKGVK